MSLVRLATLLALGGLVLWLYGSALVSMSGPVYLVLMYLGMVLYSGAWFVALAMRDGFVQGVVR